MTQPLIRAEELAKRLDVSESLVYRLARNHQIPAYRVGGSWRFDEAEVKAALAKEATAS